MPGPEWQYHPGTTSGRVWVIAAITAACHGGKAVPPPVVHGEDSLVGRRAAVLALVSKPRCERVDQCRAAPLGAKPCGGPWSYVVFSTATTDSVRLAKAAAEYTALEVDQNRRAGVVSECQFVTAPKLSCSQGYCVSVNR